MNRLLHHIIRLPRHIIRQPRLHRLALLALICLYTHTAAANIYIIIYATRDGRTGHAGIAVDNHRILTTASGTDTLADGTLTYYDLWPAEDAFTLSSLSKDREAKYYKLPNAIWHSPITITSLYDGGIPHREHYAPDALLMIPTNKNLDRILAKYLDSVINTNHPFNPRHYNCSDFVITAINRVTGQHLRAREFMPFAYTTTPNKLCRRLMRQPGTKIIKDPGDKISGAFLWQRIFKKKPPPSFLASNKNDQNQNF